MQRGKLESGRNHSYSVSSKKSFFRPWRESYKIVQHVQLETANDKMRPIGPQQCHQECARPEMEWALRSYFRYYASPIRDNERPRFYWHQETVHLWEDLVKSDDVCVPKKFSRTESQSKRKRRGFSTRQNWYVFEKDLQRNIFKANRLENNKKTRHLAASCPIYLRVQRR